MIFYRQPLDGIYTEEAIFCAGKQCMVRSTIKSLIYNKVNDMYLYNYFILISFAGIKVLVKTIPKEIELYC